MGGAAQARAGEDAEELVGDLLGEGAEGGPLAADQGVDGEVDAVAGREDGEAVVAADLAGGEGVAARQRADAAEAEDDMRAVDADGGEGLLHGVEDVVHLGVVAGRIGIVGGNVGCAGDDPALDGVEDADAAVAVDEVDHVVAGWRGPARGGRGRCGSLWCRR